MFLFRKNIILVPSDYDGYSLSKGLLSFDCYDNKTKCSLHCYNLPFDRPLTLGISIAKKLHKITVPNASQKNFNFELPAILNNRDEISSVLLDIGDDDYQIVLWGSTQITSGWKTSLDLMLQDEEIVSGHKNSINQNTKSDSASVNERSVATSKSFDDNETFVQTKLDETEKNFTGEEIGAEFDDKETFKSGDAEPSIISSNSSDIFNSSSFDINQFLKQNERYFEDSQREKNDKFNQNCDACAKNENDKNFIVDEPPVAEHNLNQHKIDIFEEPYSEGQINQIADQIINMTEKYENGISAKNLSTDEDVEVKLPNKQNNAEATFFERINPQIEYMFASNKAETVLNEIIPNGKFCKVDFDDGSGYYVFGIINENGEPKYLCYGVPAKKDAEPPKELSNLYQWLPIDASDDNGDGFYMMYQDALTGKNISVDII